MHAAPQSSLSSRARFALAALIVAALGTAAAIVAPITAQAAPIALSGVIVGPANTALSGVAVSAVKLTAAGDATTTTATATSAGGGAFAFPSLPAGDWTLRFANTATTYAQYLGGSTGIDGAQRIVLEDGGGNAAFVKAELSASGVVSGKVTTTANKAIAKITVRAYTQDGSGAWVVSRSVVTSSTGAYSISGLAPGGYRLEAIDLASAKPVFASAFSGDAISLKNATEVGVLPGKTASYSFKLSAGSTVKVFTLGDGLAPLAGVTVVPYRYIFDGTTIVGVEKLQDRALVSNAAGELTFTGLPNGTYTYEYIPTGTTYARTFFFQEPTLETAFKQVISFPTQHQLGKFSLLHAASVTGIVTDQATGDPIPNVQVTLDKQNADPFDGSHPARSVMTDENGVYLFPGIAGSNWTIWLGSHTSGNTDYVRRVAANLNLSAGDLVGGANYTMVKKVAGQLHPTTDPHILDAGDVWNVGSQMTLSTGAWTNDGSGFAQTFSYQWYRGARLLPGATSVHYTTAPGDVGESLSVKVTARDFGFGSTSVFTAASTVIQPGTIQPDVPPSVTGTLEVGSTLTAQVGTWDAYGIDADGFPVDSGIVWTFQWQRSANGTTWTDITGATTRTYVPVLADLAGGANLRVALTGTRYGYNDVNVTALAGSVQQGTYVNVTPPKVTKSGTTLKVSNGTWTPNTLPTTYAYLWTVWEANGTNTTYATPTLGLSGKTGKYITVAVHPQIDGVSGTPIVLTAQVGAKLTATGANAVTGTVAVGSTVTAPVGTFVVTPTTTTYQWQYLSGKKWKSIPSATAASYLIDGAYLGKALRVVSTFVKPGYTTGTRISTQTAKVAIAGALTPTTPPTASGLIGGSPASNTTITVDPGVWNPAATTFSYAWSTSTTNGGTQTAIAGAVTATYKVPASLVGKWLSVKVTAKRAGSTTGSYPLSLGQVVNGYLVNTVAPKVTHTGLVYSVTPGTWAPVQDSFTATWQAYDDALQPGSNLGNANPIDLSSTALTRPVRVQVTVDKSGYAPTTSAWVLAKKGTFVPTSAVGIDFPDGAIVDAQLSAHMPAGFGPDAGTYTLGYRWEYESSPGVWKAIAGATSAQFTPTGATYVGKKVRVVVIVSSPLYETLEAPSAGETIGLGVPLLASGTSGSPLTAAIEQKLTAIPGTWTPAATSYSYQWYESPPGFPTWNPISGATGATYTVSTGLINRQVMVVVTGHRAGHEDGQSQYSFGVVGQGLIPNVTLPKVTKAGSKLTVSKGTWTGTGLTYSYEWRRYTYDASSFDTVSTSSSYTMTADDIDDDYLLIDVIVRVSKGPGWHDNSATIHARPAVLYPSVDTAVTGTRVDGQLLTAVVPSFLPSGVQTSLAWLRNGVVIPGETGTTYLQGAADIGKTVTVRVTATRAGYLTSVTTGGSGMTLSTVLPENTLAPSIALTGDLRVGMPATASPGTWSLPGLTYAYQWYRAGVKIPGATSAAYTPIPDDVTQEIEVRVTAAKAGTYSPVTARSESHFVDAGPAPVLKTPTPGAFATSGISGTGLVGAKLTVASLTWNMPVTLEYRWSVKHAADPGFTFIPGANAASFSPTVAGGFVAGDQVRVTVVATRAGYGGTVITSTRTLAAAP